MPSSSSSAFTLQPQRNRCPRCNDATLFLTLLGLTSIPFIQLLRLSLDVNVPVPALNHLPSQLEPMSESLGGKFFSSHEQDANEPIAVVDANVFLSNGEEKSPGSTKAYSTIHVPEYDAWLEAKRKNYTSTCEGWPEYKEWIDALFRLAPQPAPSCDVVQSFVEKYKSDPRNALEMKRGGMLLFQRNVNKPGPKGRSYDYGIQINGKPVKLRMKSYTYLWYKAVKKRELPPNMEMLLYTNDKPRVLRDLGLPTFSVATEYPAGMGLPHTWKHHLPFPSHLYIFHSTSIKPLLNFESKEPKVFFRGRLSENCWANFSDPANDHCTREPRFKLANATRHTSNGDVLDVKLTGIAVGDVKGSHRHIWRTLQQRYNISKGQRTPLKLEQGRYRYVLASPSNGWAGTTTMNALQKGAGSCMLFVNDTTTDDEGFTRELGEIYFPLLKPDRDMVVVEGYEKIADVARQLNANPTKGKQCGEHGYAFAKKFLGQKCAMDLIELLTWSFYRYVKTGCPNAFDHVQIR